MDVSIIIINYNTYALTKAAIESVFDKTEGIAYELIVVDNNSPDGSGQQLKDFFDNKIVYVQSNENVGFGRANNFAFEYAKGRNIFLLNSDTLLLNNAIKILSDYLDNNSHVGVCGGNLYNQNMLPAHSFSRCFPSVFWELNTFFAGFPYKVRYGKNTNFNHTNSPLEVGIIVGADMMLRTSVLKMVGVFDPNFFMYHEEAELTYRIKKAGFQAHSVPNAKIIHLEGKSSSNNVEKLKIQMHGLKTYYQKTHHGYCAQIIIKILFAFTVLTRIIVFTVIGNKQKRQYWQSAWRYM